MPISYRTGCCILCWVNIVDHFSMLGAYFFCPQIVAEATTSVLTLSLSLPLSKTHLYPTWSMGSGCVQHQVLDPAPPPNPERRWGEGMPLAWHQGPFISGSLHPRPLKSMEASAACPLFKFPGHPRKGEWELSTPQLQAPFRGVQHGQLGRH